MDVAIVGGGLAGLTAAYDLVRFGSQVTLFDDQADFGGQVRTRHQDGFLIEDGAEGFVSADTAVPALCRDLGIDDALIHQAEHRSLLYRDGGLSELSSRDAAMLLGIPVPGASETRGLASLRNGMGSLAAALAAAIQDKATLIRARVASLRRSKGGWQLETADGRGSGARHVLMAVPPTAAATLLAPIDSEAARTLRDIPLTSNLSVSLAFPRSAVSDPLTATGLVIAPDSARADGLRACVFCSSKFANRAPPGYVLLRAFFRPDSTDLAAPDHEWVQRAFDALSPILGLRGRESASWVSRWPAAIPQYGPGHTDLVARLTAQLEAAGHLTVAGAAYLPGGVPGAVRSGRAAASSLRPSLRA